MESRLCEILGVNLDEVFFYDGIPYKIYENPHYHCDDGDDSNYKYTMSSLDSHENISDDVGSLELISIIENPYKITCSNINTTLKDRIINYDAEKAIKEDAVTSDMKYFELRRNSCYILNKVFSKAELKEMNDKEISDLIRLANKFAVIYVNRSSIFCKVLNVELCKVFLYNGNRYKVHIACDDDPNFRYGLYKICNSKTIMIPAIEIIDIIENSDKITNWSEMSLKDKVINYDINSPMTTYGKRETEYYVINRTFTKDELRLMTNKEIYNLINLVSTYHSILLQEREYSKC